MTIPTSVRPPRAALAPGLALAACLTLGACDDATGPGGEPFRGVDFGLEEGRPGHHAARGTPAAGAAALAGDFAVAVGGSAVPDSLGGLVLLSYDAGTADLFILQVQSDAAGSYTCGPVEVGPACHGRLLEDVRLEGGVLEVEGRFELTAGRIVLKSVGPDEVRGTFQARLERTHPAGTGEVLEIDDGRIAVELAGEVLSGGTLGCLLAPGGSGGACGG